MVLLPAAIAALVYGFEVFQDGSVASLVCKALPVLSLAAWVGRDGPLRRRVAIGLVFGALGDVLLDASPSLFVAGLVAFLLGHLAYIAAFFVDAHRWRSGWLLPAFAWPTALYAYLAPHLGPMAVPVAAYAATIGTMFLRAAVRLREPAVPPASARWGFAGALLFTISDSALAVDLFHHPLDHGRALVLSTYWGGQLGIAMAARAAR